MKTITIGMTFPNDAARDEWEAEHLNELCPDGMHIFMVHHSASAFSDEVTLDSIVCL